MLMIMCNIGHSALVAMALLLRGEMMFLWQRKEEALQDLNRVAEMHDVDTEVRVAIGNNIVLSNAG